MTWTRERTWGAAVASAVLLLGLPSSGVALASVPAAVSAAAPRVSPPDPAFPAGCSAGVPAQLDKPLLDCLAKAARSSRSGTVVLTVTRPLPLGVVDQGDVRDARKAFADGRFAVVLSGGDSGAGGSLLLTLAADASSRAVARDAVVARLDARTVGLLKNAGGCEALCAQLAAAPEAGLAGERIIAERQAQENDGLFALPTRGAGGDEGVPAWTLALPALGLLVLLALAVPVRRRLAGRRGGTGGGLAAAYGGGVPTASPVTPPQVRAPGAPPRPGRPAGAPRDVPGGPRRTATVRTSLHPQGYVELDHCLVRATWADSGEPPAVGEPVDTVAAESGAVLAVRPSRRGKN